MGEQSNRAGLNGGETCASIAPRPLRSLEAAHRTERGRHQRALPFRELRPPAVEQQHHAQLRGLVLHVSSNTTSSPSAAPAARRRANRSLAPWKSPPLSAAKAASL